MIGKRVILSFEGAEQAIEVEGLPVTPYLVPQECGMHMETECVTVYRKDTLNNSDTSEETFGLTFRACGEKLDFPVSHIRQKSWKMQRIRKNFHCRGEP